MLKRSVYLHRRSRWEIIEEVLEAASKEVKLTRLMHRVNIDYRGLQRYLDFLDKNGFIKITLIQRSEKMVKTTGKGDTLLEKLREVKKVLSEGSPL